MAEPRAGLVEHAREHFLRRVALVHRILRSWIEGVIADFRRCWRVLGDVPRCGLGLVGVAVCGDLKHQREVVCWHQHVLIQFEQSLVGHHAHAFSGNVVLFPAVALIEVAVPRHRDGLLNPRQGEAAGGDVEFEVFGHDAAVGVLHGQPPANQSAGIGGDQHVRRDGVSIVLGLTVAVAVYGEVEVPDEAQRRAFWVRGSARIEQGGVA